MIDYFFHHRLWKNGRRQENWEVRVGFRYATSGAVNLFDSSTRYSEIIIYLLAEDV
jgi:hypothetical protein